MGRSRPGRPRFGQLLCLFDRRWMLFECCRPLDLCLPRLPVLLELRRLVLLGVLRDRLSRLAVVAGPAVAPRGIALCSPRSAGERLSYHDDALLLFLLHSLGCRHLASLGEVGTGQIRVAVAGVLEFSPLLDGEDGPNEEGRDEDASPDDSGYYPHFRVAWGFCIGTQWRGGCPGRFKIRVWGHVEE